MDVVRRFVVVFGDCHTLFYFQTFVCLFGIYYLDESAVRDCNAMTRDEQIFVWIFAPKDPNQILYVRPVSAVMNCLIGTKLELPSYR